MKILTLLLLALAYLATISAQAINHSDFRIDHDPVAGPETFTLSWVAKEGFLYTLLGSETLLNPWFVIDQEADFQDEELAEWSVQPDADRFFFKLLKEEDHGLRISARCESEMGIVIDLDISEWVNENEWDNLRDVVIERSASREGLFDEIGRGSLGADGHVQFVDLTANEGETHYYRGWFTYEYFGGSEGPIYDSPYSNVAFAHATCGQPGAPELFASCRPDRIVVRWEPPAWVGGDYGFRVDDQTLLRSTDPEGPFNPVGGFLALGAGQYIDESVSEGTTYYYKASFTYSNHKWDIEPSPVTLDANIAEATAFCDPPPKGPMDIAFIVDNTGSMSHLGSVEKMRAKMAGILDAIETASGGDYRLALVTPDDDIVNVRLPFSPNNRVEFLAAMNIFGANGFDGTFFETDVDDPNALDDYDQVKFTKGYGEVIEGLYYYIRTSGGSGIQPVSIALFDTYSDAQSFTNHKIGPIGLIDPAIRFRKPWSTDVFGSQAPESTDECLNTVVNGLWECHRDPNAIPREEQKGDFFPPFGFDFSGNLREALKVTILITDDLPGGFFDNFNATVKGNAATYAEMARCNDVRILAILEDPGLDDLDVAIEVMRNYAKTTCGWYSQVEFGGEGIDDAILNAVYEDLPPCSTPMPTCENFDPIAPCDP